VGGSGRGNRRGDDAGGTTGDDGAGGATAGGATASDAADDVAVGDRIAAAVEELYGADPEAFTGRRSELVTAARAGGDRAAVKAIGALRKPTRAAWVVNRLARTDPGAPSKLAELAVALRAAQRAGDGPRLRELSAERGALIDALTSQALTTAGVPDSPPALRLEVTETLTAALADPEVAAAFAEGTLTRAMQWSGFGVLPAETGSGAEAAAEKAVSAARGGATGTRDRSPQDGTGTARSRSRSRTDAPSPAAADGGRTGKAGTARAERAGTARAAQAEQAAERRRAAQAERTARAAAERAARRREQHEEAEREVAAASTAAAEAGAAEDRLEAEVRDLETRLGEARAGLEKARLHARRAEAAERRARQALDRLPGE
jgi:hypothetical protein